MTRTIHTGRTAGILLPLFSMPSTRSWGIGEIGDLVPMTRWLQEAGLGVLQLLPTNEMAPGQTSPYSAISAMALDPIYISMHAVRDFTVFGGEAATRSRRSGGDPIRTQRHARRLCKRATRQGARAPHGVQPLLGYGVGARHRARGLVRRILLVGGVVAGRLRAVSRAPRAKRRATVDGVGGALAAPRSGGSRSRP